MFIDAHCHLSDPRIYDNLSLVLQIAQNQKISRFIQGGVDLPDWEKQLQLKNLYPDLVSPVFGIHPWALLSTATHTIADQLELLPKYLPRAVALGEIGLDFGPRFTAESRDAQVKFFRGQLMIAKNCGKPVVLHVVRAHELVLEILADFKPLSGIVHAFSADSETAQKYLDLGLSLSLGAAATQAKYAPTIKTFPLNKIVVETDFPDMLPHGRKADIFTKDGKPLNSPSSLWYIAETIAGVKDSSAEAILGQSRENLRDIFSLDQNF